MRTLSKPNNSLIDYCRERGHVAGVVGLQYGDEGKGKIITALQKHFKMVVRAQGGGNAGHTIMFNGRQLVLNHLPSGLAGNETIGVLGQGMVININTVAEEIQRLENVGKEMRDQKNIILMGGAQFILPSLQGKLDAYGSGHIGTTGKGIGPAYALKALRQSTTFNDMVSRPDECKDGFDALGKMFSDETGLDLEEIIKEFDEHRELLLRLIKEGYVRFDPVNSTVVDAFHNGSPILLEGAQAHMLDLDHGTFPYVTSSKTGYSGLMSGSACPNIHTKIGVMKPYTTRVGAGPFMSQLADAEQEQAFVDAVGERGATTGRMRSIGALNFVELRYALRCLCPDILAVTKLDILPQLGETTDIVTRYQNNQSGQEYVHSIPPIRGALNGRGDRFYEKIIPITEQVPVPQADIAGITDFADIPQEYHPYIQKIIKESGFRGTRVVLGTGPDNDQYCEAQLAA